MMIDKPRKKGMFAVFFFITQIPGVSHTRHGCASRSKLAGTFIYSPLFAITLSALVLFTTTGVNNMEGTCW